MKAQKKYKLKMIKLGRCQDCGKKAINKNRCLKCQKLQDSYVTKWKRKKRVQRLALKYKIENNIR